MPGMSEITAFRYLISRSSVKVAFVYCVNVTANVTLKDVTTGVGVVTGVVTVEVVAGVVVEFVAGVVVERGRERQRGGERERGRAGELFDTTATELP